MLGVISPIIPIITGSGTHRLLNTFHLHITHRSPRVPLHLQRMPLQQCLSTGTAPVGGAPNGDPNDLSEIKQQIDACPLNQVSIVQSSIKQIILLYTIVTNIHNHTSWHSESWYITCIYMIMLSNMYVYIYIHMHACIDIITLHLLSEKLT